MNQMTTLGSIQRALIGHITPNLRAVYVVVDNKIGTLFFYYDNPLSDLDQELSSLTDTEFIADFPAPDYKTDCSIIVLPYPKPIPNDGFCAYKRYEPLHLD